MLDDAKNPQAEDSYIEDVRELAKNNFYFFCRAICQFDRLTDRFHKDICHEIQYRGAIRRLWLLPRDHYKSTIVSIAYPIWRLINDPEERILIASDTATNAEAKLTKIKSIILKSDGIRAFFPEIRPPNLRKTTWSESAITLPRKGHHAEPSISTVGAGGAIVGHHFTHILLDDVVAREAAESPTIMESVKGWVDNVESLLVEPYNNTIDVVGTRWSHNDIYSHIDEFWPDGNTKDVPNFFTRFQLGFWDGLPEHDGVLFPELYDGVQNAKNFARRSMKQNQYLWSCNYLNDPTIPEAEFDLDDLQYFTYDADYSNVLYESSNSRQPHVTSLENMSIYLTCDPAYSKKMGASYAAIIISGCTPWEVFILESKKGRWGGQGLLRELKNAVKKYRGKIRAVGIEATGTQIAFIDDVRKSFRRDGLFTRIDELLPGSTKSKEARIRFHLQPYIGERRIFIPPESNDLRKEFQHFPLDLVNRDLLDAMAYAAQHYWSRNHGLESTEKSSKEHAEVRERTRSKKTGY